MATKFHRLLISDLEDKKSKITCGVIMPLSSMETYPSEHWSMVQSIIYEAITTAGFQPDMVSNSDEVSIIQKNIVQNIYNNEIIVCDISGRNANVMFELGMRLTFDKPTVIVKDDLTPAPFDTSIIEYIPYRKDLRYPDIQDFKRKLSSKLLATHKLKDDPDYSPFIKHFGPFTVPKLEQKEVGPMDFVIENLNSLRKEVRALSNSQKDSSKKPITLLQFEDFLKMNALETDGGNDNIYYPLKKFLDEKRVWILENSSVKNLPSIIESEYYEHSPKESKYAFVIKRWIKEYLFNLGLNVPDDDQVSDDDNEQNKKS